MQNRIDWRQNLFFVWISQFLSMAAFASSYTFLPFYLQEIGLNQAEVNWYFALICGLGNLAFAIAAPLWGVLADRYGRKMMLLRANFGAALLIPVMGLLTDPDWLVIHRIACGVVTGTIAAAQTLTLSTTPEEKRNLALGVLSSAIYSGGTIGQFLGGPLVSWIGFSMTFLVSGILLGVSGVLVLLFARENFHPVERRFCFRFEIPRFGRIWMLFFLFFFLCVSRDFGGLYTVILVDEVMGDHQTALRYAGYLSGIASIAAILSGVLLGYMADRMKLLPLLVVALALGALLRFPQGMAGDFQSLLLYSCLFTFCCAGLEPLLQSWLAGVTPASEHGRYFGWAACFKAVGWSGASLFSGGVAKLCDDNVRSVFVSGGLLLLCAVPLTLWIAKFISPPDRAKQAGAK